MCLYVQFNIVLIRTYLFREPAYDSDISDDEFNG